MRIYALSEEPVRSVAYRYARTLGGVGIADLPILMGSVEGLPSTLDAIVCTGDLQGTGIASGSGQEPRLLGEILAEELIVVLEILSLAPERTGIVLAGDLYSSPQADQRGASGDVRPVWDAFCKRYAWVAGVLGNHDRFDSPFEGPNAHLLDGDICHVDGLTLAGISGIIGNAGKPLRRSADDYLLTLERLNRKKPDLLILHPSPAVEECELRGEEALGAAYRQKAYPLTVCGHVFWPTPFVELGNGNPLLNVDSRVVVLSHKNL